MNKFICKLCGTFLKYQKNIASHTQVCPKTLPDRLKNIISQWKHKHNFIGFNLSSFWCIDDRHIYEICPYTADGNRKNFESYCAVCGQEATYKGPMLHRMIKMKHNGVTVYYYRCEKCHKKNKLLCEITLQDTPRSFMIFLY